MSRTKYLLTRSVNWESAIPGWTPVSEEKIFTQNFFGFPVSERRVNHPSSSAVIRITVRFEDLNGCKNLQLLLEGRSPSFTSH